MEKIHRRDKLIVGDSSSFGKTVRRGKFSPGKFSSGKNVCHLAKFSSLFTDEVFPDKVFRRLESAFIIFLSTTILEALVYQFGISMYISCLILNASNQSIFSL